MNKIFAIMPFGTQASYKNKKVKIDFDSIYYKAIKPACEEVGLKVIRADEEITGGIIHSLMFERLVCANIAIVDVSNQNANVCYELGFRHCARESHTIIIFDQDSKLPFDFAFERAIPYKLNKGVISNENAEALKDKLKQRLNDIKISKNIKDSPAFELIDNFPVTKLDEKKLKIYAKKQLFYEEMKDKLSNCSDTQEIETCIEKIKKSDLSLKILAYYIVEKLKEMKAWSKIIDFLSNETKEDINNSVYYMQQLSIAYNKRGGSDDKQKAINILAKLLQEYGESSETYSLLGSIYKTMYKDESNNITRQYYLDLSIANYQKGFDSDITDYYPGINLATLLFEKYFLTSNKNLLIDMQDVLAVVKYDLKILNTCDYWHFATLFEASVLLKNYSELDKIINDLCMLNIQNKIPDWKKETTLKNLLVIKNIYENNDERTDWYEKFKNKLEIKEVSNV